MHFKSKYMYMCNQFFQGRILHLSQFQRANTFLYNLSHNYTAWRSGLECWSHSANLANCTRFPSSANVQQHWHPVIKKQATFITSCMIVTQYCIVLWCKTMLLIHSPPHLPVLCINICYHHTLVYKKGTVPTVLLRSFTSLLTLIFSSTDIL